jgi:hypothetical protein
MKLKGSTMKSKQPRARNFTVRLGALELESLDLLARVQGGTPSDAIRFAIRSAAALTRDAQVTEERNGTKKN